MGYEIGQVVGAVGRVRPVCAGGAPAWYALRSWPQREANAIAWLDVMGVEAWTPIERMWRAAGRGRTRRLYQRRIAPGYVFARFRGQPDWPRLFLTDPGARYLRGVVGIGGRAVEIPEAEMAAVARMPERLLRDAAEMRAAAETAARIEVGDRVRIRSGPFEQFVVDVTAVHDGVAALIVEILGGRQVIEMDQQELDRMPSEC